MRLWRGSNVQELRNEIQNLLGIPEQGQNLIYRGCSLQDNHTLQEYNITTDSTIIINLRLRGGCSGTNSKNTSSKNTSFFKDAVKGKGKAKVNLATNPVLPGPYIVEQKPENPALTIEMPKVKDLYSDLFSHSVICRFNGYLPKSGDLHHWIHTTWTPNCEIYLCPKGFFIVRFNTKQEKKHILNKGPWFWPKSNYGQSK